MNAPRDRIAFLASSPHRVAILRALADGPACNRDLRARTDASRATVARALSAFTDANWVRDENGTYRISPVGRLVLDTYDATVERMEAVETLEALVEHLDLEETDLPLADLGDAELVRPRPGNQFAHIQRGTELLLESDSVTVVAGCMARPFLTALREWSERTDAESEQVYAAPALTDIRENVALASKLRSMLEVGSQAWVYDGDIPDTLFVLDDRVLVLLSDGVGPPSGLLVSEEGAVRRWAESAFETYRSNARPVEPPLPAAPPDSSRTRS